MTKLTQFEVEVIKGLAYQYPARKVGLVFRVTRQTILSIWRQETWIDTKPCTQEMAQAVWAKGGLK